MVENFSDYGEQIWENIFDFDSDTVAELASKILDWGQIERY